MASPMTPSHVVIAYDATKDCGWQELKITINDVMMRGDILRPGDTIVVLGVLHRVVHPMGYQAKPCPGFFGTSFRAVEEEVTKKVHTYVNMLLHSAEKCEDLRVSIEVKVTAGYPIKQVILQEIMACNAAWVVLDRHIRRDLNFYLKQIPCKLALIQDSLTVHILKRHTTDDTDTIEHKTLFSLSKPVPLFRKDVLSVNVMSFCKSSPLHFKIAPEHASSFPIDFTDVLEVNPVSRWIPLHPRPLHLQKRADVLKIAGPSEQTSSIPGVVLLE